VVSRQLPLFFFAFCEIPVQKLTVAHPPASLMCLHCAAFVEKAANFGRVPKEIPMVGKCDGGDYLLSH